MKKSTFFLIKIALTALMLGVLIACFLPIKSNTLAHIVLSPFEKKFRNKIEFSSSRIWLPGNIFLEDMSIIDEKGRLYYCKTAEIKYNLLDLFLKRKGLLCNLKKIKLYRNIGLLDSVTSMLVIAKMPDVEFEEIGGGLQFRKDTVYIKDAYAYNDAIRIKGSGWIDKNGMLDCDVNFLFHKDITDKMPDAVKTVLLTREDGGWMGISFKVHGNYKKPSLHITGNKLELNIMEGLLSDE